MSADDQATPKPDTKESGKHPTPASSKRITVAPPARSSSQMKAAVRAKRASPAFRPTAIDFDLMNGARRIIEGSLGVVRGDRLLIVVDRARSELGPALIEVANTVGAQCELIELEDVAARPARELPQLIRDAAMGAQASILLIGFEDEEVQMRMELLEIVDQKRLRHAHMVGATRKSMIAGFSVDPSRVHDATRAVRARLRPDSVFKLRSAAGSDLVVKLSSQCRWMEHVGIIRPGRWENLPSGELVTSPLEVNGVFVGDGSLGGNLGAMLGLIAKSPIRLEIQANVVTSVACADKTLLEGVEGFLHSEPGADRVGTIILGTNVGILEPTGEFICDQNCPGLHLTLGRTYPEHTGMPSPARTYIALTGMRADVDLDGAPLLRRGRYMIV